MGGKRCAKFLDRSLKSRGVHSFFMGLFSGSRPYGNCIIKLICIAVTLGTCGCNAVLHQWWIKKSLSALCRSSEWISQCSWGSPTLEGCSKEDRLVLWRSVFFIRIKLVVQCLNKAPFSAMPVSVNTPRIWILFPSQQVNALNGNHAMFLLARTPKPGLLFFY